MTEEDARAWLRAQQFGPDVLDRLDRYAALLVEENAAQNLIARSTVDSVMARHIVDSAQLHRLLPAGPLRIADIGSGPGLPGIVLGILGHQVSLVEPRRRRCDFLARCVDLLGLRGCEVVHARMEKLTGKFPVITARAVAAATALLDGTAHIADRSTIWVLPRGAGGDADLVDLRADWDGMFHVERSVTDVRSSIIVATDVRRRKQ